MGYASRVCGYGRIFTATLCVAFLSQSAVAELPPLGSDVPNSMAHIEPPLKLNWQPNQPVSYQFTLEAKVATESLRVMGRTTYTPTTEPSAVDDELSDDGSGTGFVIHPEGILVTCAHVVKGATKITAQINGQEYQPTVIGVDWENDVAVLRVPARDLAYLSFADSDRLRLADSVRALGFPLSDLLGETMKVTRGEISGIGDSEFGRLLQIDVTINPGNSGGPVLDASGRVVGIACQTIGGFGIARVGFAMPSNNVVALAKRLNVPVATLDSAPELPAPDLIARATPAVARLKVECGAGGFGLEQQQSLTYTGSYSMSETIIGRPPYSSDRGKLVVDRLGQVVSFEGDADLPFMMGRVGTVGIETLPASGKDQSATTRPIFLQRTQQRTGSSSGPPLFDLRSPYGFRAIWQRLPERTTVAIHEGVERISYEYGATDQDVVELKKKYELTFAGASKDDLPFVTLLGQGVAKFDKKIGLIQTMNHRATLTVNQDNVTVRVPINFTYKRKDPEELAKEQAEAKARVDAAVASARTQVQSATPPGSTVPGARTPRITPPTSKYPNIHSLTPSPALDQFDPSR